MILITLSDRYGHTSCSWLRTEVPTQGELFTDLMKAQDTFPNLIDALLLSHIQSILKRYDSTSILSNKLDKHEVFEFDSTFRTWSIQIKKVPTFS